MPRGNRMGPEGMGPMTGRGAGYCAGYDVPGYANPAPGRFGGRAYGWGRGMQGMAGMRGGRGGGRGRRNRFYATGQPGWMGAGWAPAWGAPWAPPEVSEEQEVAALQEQADYLKSALDEITQRLDELRNEE